MSGYDDRPPPYVASCHSSTRTNLSHSPSVASQWSGHGHDLEPLTKVELSISCANLKDMDFFSKSDPMVVMFVKHSQSGRWKEYDRTECIDDNLNPEFVKKFIINYYFEEVQHIKFEVYDLDSNSRNLKHHDFIGKVEMTLAEASQGTITRQLVDKNGNTREKRGEITITSEERNEGGCNKKFFFNRISVKDIPKLNGWFSSKPNCFFQISKTNESSNEIVVYKSSPVYGRDPFYPKFSLDSIDLCNNDTHRPIIIQLVHQERNGDVKSLCRFQTTPHQLESTPMLELVFKNTFLTIESHSEAWPSFMQYLNSGNFEMDFHVAIDFTASNGDPSNPNSLHYCSTSNPNSYEFAISSVGQVLEQYDSDRRFSAFGFGARLPPSGQVFHDFALNFDPTNPEIDGTIGILEAYRRCIQTVRLFGPTNFSPIIRRTTDTVRRIQNDAKKQTYTVLMIITDGVITDMDQTKDAIVDAADQAMSIIIIGVGKADFTNMEVLDGDDKRVCNSRGREAARDIVQFVAIKDFNLSINDIPSSALNKEILHEIPKQVVDHFTTNNIFPYSVRR